jgi:hypothetical protein
MRHYRAVIKPIAARRFRLGPALPALWLAGLLWSCPVRAQTPAELPDAGPPVEAGPPPPDAAAVAAAAQPARSGLVSAQVGVRSLVLVQDPSDREELGDTAAIGEANVVFSGRVHRFLKWQAGFAGLLGDAGTTSAALLDLVAKLELADALNLWIGRMPAPADRASLSTVWAITPWTLPGQYGSFAAAPLGGERAIAGLRRGALAREDGVTLWGQLGGGRFKYYVGAFGLAEPARSPLYSARLALDLLDPEPGYRAAGSYFGAKDVLAFGAAVQHRTQGSRPAEDSAASAADFDALSADVLWEIGGDPTGVLDIEGAFAKVWGDHELVSYQCFALVSYLVPLEVGIGRFQPLVRVQHAGAGSAPDGGDFTSLDTQLGYIIAGHHARATVGWVYSRIGGQPQNAILLGLQLLSTAK